MATKKVEKIRVTIPALRLEQIHLNIVGDTPLICHAWDQKNKIALLNNQRKKASEGKEMRRPAVEFADSLYWLTEKPNFDGLTDEEAQEILAEVIPKSKFGFPSLAFKSAALDGGLQQGLLASKAGGAALAKTTARGAVRVLEEFVEIEGTPTIREDICRINKGSSAQLRYRGEFKTWSASLKVQYNVSAISVEQIISIFNVGGFAVGVGEWRPAKDGTFGTYHVE